MRRFTDQNHFMLEPNSAARTIPRIARANFGIRRFNSDRDYPDDCDIHWERRLALEDPQPSALKNLEA